MTGLSFAGLMLAGMPIAFVLLGATLVFVLMSGNPAILNSIPQILFGSVENFDLLAIPLFVLAGSIMDVGGLTRRLIGFANSIVGRFRGGLSLTAVWGCFLFGGVSGSAAADAGTLAFMVGCDEGDFARVEAALEPMSRITIRAGDHGAGQAAKICNNMLLGISMMGTCEAIALAEKLGLDPERFFEIASKSSGQCWSVTSYYPWPGPVPTAPSNRDYQGGFATAMMLKDLKLAQDAAAKSGASTPLGAQAEAMYALFDRLGHGSHDFSAMLQLLRGRLAELESH